MAFRGLFVVVFGAALAVSVGCGGGSDSGGGPAAPALYCTDSGSAGPNTVTMDCGGKSDATTERVTVTIEGPASGTMTLRGLSFDITYDPAKLEFVPTTLTSPLFASDALILAVTANGQQGRVIVGIQQAGTQPDVSVGAGQHAVVDLYFRRVPAATFDPTPLTFERASATAATPAVTFSSSLALEYQ